MSQLLLLNPRRRRRKVKKSGGSRKRRRKVAVARVSINPRRRRRVRRNPVAIPGVGTFANPRRRRRASRHVARRRYRSNPSSRRLTMNNVISQVTEAGTGAVGATLVDILMGFVAPRLPVTLLTPTLYPVVKGGAAILFGTMLGGMGGQLGRLGVQGAKGSLTCTLRDTIRMYLPANLSLGYINSGMIARNGGMSAYTSPMRGVRTPLMGVRTPLMGLGQSPSEEESKWYGPGYVAGGMRGMGAYVGR